MDPVVHFDLKTPLNETIIRQHIAQSKALGLPTALGEPRSLTVIAGGPSARLAPQRGNTLALNGALKICSSPTFYAACDPQEHLADFLDEPPESTVYYIASKCHPRVFAALADRHVKLWDVADYVPGGIPTAPSITLTALSLFARMGWRRFDIWGWDACYQGARHHVIDQPHNGDDRTVLVGDRAFKSTTTWAAEAQDALYVIAVLEYLGCEINIHGDSMIQAIREAA